MPPCLRSFTSPLTAAMLHLPPPTPLLSKAFSTKPILVPNTPLKDFEALLTDHGGKWSLSHDGKGLERTLKFKTFKRTRVYNKAFIRLTTHKDKESGESGISAKDLDFARFCDEAIGNDDILTEGAADSSWGPELTTRVAEAAQPRETAVSTEEGSRDTVDALEEIKK
ncbi:hypothetical protein MMC11_008693 [Xylographa trunciseda]|nr:hypothetical protein [Xylographa trunciseda]